MPPGYKIGNLCFLVVWICFSHCFAVEEEIDRQEAQALGLSPPASPGRPRQPVEFDQAINYVTRIKVRFLFLWGFVFPRLHI